MEKKYSNWNQPDLLNSEKKNSRILREAIRINQVQTTIRIQEFCLRLASLLLLLL